MWAKKEAVTSKECHVKFTFQVQFWEKIDELMNEGLQGKQLNKIQWTNKINSLEWSFPKNAVETWIAMMKGSETRQHGGKTLQGCLAYCRILMRSFQTHFVDLDAQDAEYEKKNKLVQRRKEFAKKIPKSIFPKKKKFRKQDAQKEYEEALAVQVAQLLVEETDPLDLKYSDEAMEAAMKKAVQAMEGSFLVSSESED